MGVGVGAGFIPKGKGYHRNSTNCELTLACFQADDESREIISFLGHFPNLHKILNISNIRATTYLCPGILLCPSLLQLVNILILVSATIINLSSMCHQYPRKRRIIGKIGSTGVSILGHVVDLCCSNFISPSKPDLYIIVECYLSAGVILPCSVATYPGGPTGQV